MSAYQDTNLWEFLESRNFNSTENLNKLQLVLLEHKDQLMSAYGWEYEEWVDDLPEEEDDGEDAYYRTLEEEERSFHEYSTKI
jgi:hypothetical protein